MDKRMRIRCPLCRCRLLAREEVVGERRICPSCRIEIIVPAPNEEPVEGLSAGVAVGAVLGFFVTPMLVCVGPQILFPHAGWNVAQGPGLLLPCPTLLAAPIGGLVGGWVGALLGGRRGGSQERDRGQREDGPGRFTAGPPTAPRSSSDALTVGWHAPRTPVAPDHPLAGRIAKAPRGRPQWGWLLVAAALLSASLGLAGYEFGSSIYHALVPQRPTGVGTPAAKFVAPVLSPGLRDAVLVMTFEKDTFYEKDGKTYVRDLSGRGNDGLCDGVAFTPEGKAGGGLKCGGPGTLRVFASLFNHQPNYTLTAWVLLRKNAPDMELFHEANSENDSEPICTASVISGGAFFGGAWNWNTKENWVHDRVESVFPYGQWFFLALALEKGGVETGSLRLTVDDKEFHLASQMTDTPPARTSVLFGVRFEGVLDEVTVFHRALSVQEIEAIRQQGILGVPLATVPRPRPASRYG